MKRVPTSPDPAPAATSFPRGIDPLPSMLLLAACIGGASALVVAGFRLAMDALVHLYADAGHLVAAARSLSPGWRVAVPTLAALLGGLTMWAGQRWIRHPRGPEYMEAVRVGDGQLPLLPNLLRTLSSLVAVSGGITIGREGTMIQLAAVMSSLLGRLPRIDADNRRLIVACGAAAGFASAYHAPVAGTLFVAEIILGGLQLREIAVLMVAAVLGELTTQSLGAPGPLYLSQALPPVSLGDLGGAALLGLGAGLVGPLFLALLDGSRHVYQRLIGFQPLRMTLAGFAIGLLSLLRPEVWGNGYSTVQSFLLEPWALSALGTVCLLRLLAVTAASAAGIPGGVLTPTLALGGGLGLLASHLCGVSAASHLPVLWTLIGMGALLAATTHAPAMAAIMMFEITRSYDVVMVAMPACVIASMVASLLRSRTVYSEALGLRDTALDDGRPPA